jgi:putative intracellular protease/amidase
VSLLQFVFGRRPRPVASNTETKVSEPSTSTRRVLMIAANPTTSPTTGWPIGFWWAELTHPYWAFKEAGYAVDIASPSGGDLQADGYSDPEDASGYSAQDILSLGFKRSPAHAALLKGTPPIAKADLAGYDAIFVAGGQSPMVTMIDDAALHAFVARAYEMGKITALVCHATCVLLKARLSNGDLLVKNKTWTGFANSEEAFADSFVGKKIQPFWIEDEARRIENTNFIVHERFKPFAVRDGNLITGQQQHSGAAAAALVIEALGR